jgi:hypothetical protein
MIIVIGLAGNGMIHRLVLLMSLIMLLCPQASFGAQNPDDKDNISSGGWESGNKSIWQTNTTLSSSYCQEVVDKFSSLGRSLSFPDHFQEPDAIKTNQDFDVNQYFTVLDRLSMEPRYVLDYVYYYAGLGGEPVLYARKADQPAYRNYTEFSKDGHADSPLEEDDYLNRIQVDGTPEGFFQFALLRIMGGQFYLSWHANYDDYRIVCNSSEPGTLMDGFNGSGSPPIEDVLKEARKMNFSPVVELNEDVARVHVVVFTKWGGFIRKTLTLNMKSPHKILKEEQQVLVPYDCGIRF